MSYRSSLLLRISGTVLIAFIWLAFLFLYLTIWAGPDIGADLTILLISGLIAAGVIGGLWLRWLFMR